MLARMSNKWISCLVLALVLATACGTPAGQITLKTGQCVLDSGVLATVLADLAKPDYATLIADLETRVAPAIVDCALVAIAATGGSAAGPGSATPPGEVPPAALRARELLGKRKSGK